MGTQPASQVEPDPAGLLRFGSYISPFYLWIGFRHVNLGNLSLDEVLGPHCVVVADCCESVTVWYGARRWVVAGRIDGRCG